MAIGISAIVVTFRSGATLGAALAALATASRQPIELIVVDNAADESVEALARAAWPDSRVVVNRENRGFAAAVNQGLALARNPLLLLLNPDAEPEPGAVDALIAALERLPDAGIVAPRLLDESGRPVLSCYPFLSLLTVAWRHLQLHRLLPNVVHGRYRRRALAPGAVEPFPVDWAQGACLLVRRELFDRVGPLDERFFLYCEEVDLCRRALRAGWRTYLVPTARVSHAEGASSGQVVPLKLASHFLSKVLYFDKHHGPLQTTALRALFLVDVGLRIGYRLLGRPADVRQRLVAYTQIASTLLSAGPADLERRWQALGSLNHGEPLSARG